MTDIFNWNHILKNSSQEQIVEIKEIYKYIHKKILDVQRMHMICNLGSVFLIVSGTIAGIITLNPFILGSISGSEILLQTFSEIKTTKEKLKCVVLLINHIYN